MKASAPFHLLAKPVGAACNLRCSYCFYSARRSLEPESSGRMDDATLELFVRSYIEAQPEGVREIEFAWQGGEPTLAGLGFFRRALELQQRFARPGMRVRNALQTNGTQLDAEWVALLRERRFLVGLSLDGPYELHDPHRVDARGAPTHERVVRALELLRNGGVDFNVLTVVHRLNARRPQRVYDFLVRHGARHLQFIPLVEFGPSGELSEHSIRPRDWGEFLSGVFEHWLERRHVGRVFVRQFDALVGGALGRPAADCTGARTCGRCLVIERTGEIYSCDHFVDERHRLGDLHESPLAALVDSARQREFGLAKSKELCASCLECEHLSLCFGGCPKDRIDGLNFLCEGQRRFFERALPTARAMARCIERGRPAAEWSRDDPQAAVAGSARNAACGCGSGRKWKRCCGA